jgi:hypothetical protein
VRAFTIKDKKNKEENVSVRYLFDNIDMLDEELEKVLDLKVGETIVFSDKEPKIVSDLEITRTK